MEICLNSKFWACPIHPGQCPADAEEFGLQCLNIEICLRLEPMGKESPDVVPYILRQFSWRKRHQPHLKNHSWGPVLYTGVTPVSRVSTGLGFFDLGVVPKKRRFSGETGAMPINLGYCLYNTAQSIHISLWTRWAINLCEKPLIDKTLIETQGQICQHSLAGCFRVLG